MERATLAKKSFVSVKHTCFVSVERVALGKERWEWVSGEILNYKNLPPPRSCYIPYIFLMLILRGTFGSWKVPLTLENVIF